MNSLPAGLLQATVLLSVACQPVSRADDAAVPGHEILRQMGAGGRFVKPGSAAKHHWAQFRQLDTSHDGVLSQQEAASSADSELRIPKHLFTTADENRDNTLSSDEFSVHRIIRHQAVAIFTRLDADQDMQVALTEFLQGSRISSTKLAKSTFQRLDQNSDSHLTIAECLPVWDRWARREQPPVTARLIVKRKTYRLRAEHLTPEFRRRIEAEPDVNQLPPVPKIRLILELKNTGTTSLSIWPRGGIDVPDVTVSGDGLVRPVNLKSFGGQFSATTPQPEIRPGETFQISVRSLNPHNDGLNNVYWTQPGDYRISASYPVYENLPLHLPGLFPGQPQPTGPPRKYIATAPSVTVSVVAPEKSR